MGIIILNLLLSEERPIKSTCQENTQTTRKLPKPQESHSIRIDLPVSLKSSDNTDSRAREKCGECLSPSPNSERQPDNCSHLKRETQRDSLREMPSLEES